MINYTKIAGMGEYRKKKKPKVKSKYYTGGSVHASFGKDYDDR